MMVELWMRKRDSGWRWEWYGRAEMRNQGNDWPNWVEKTSYQWYYHRIGTPTCCIGNGKLTCTPNSPSPSFSWSFPLSSLISLFCVFNSTICLEHEVKSSLSMLWSWVNTKYSIHRVHRVQHIPKTAYTEPCIHWVLHTAITAYTDYYIIPRSTVLCSQPVTHPSVDLVVLNSLHSHNHKLTVVYSFSPCRASLLIYHLQMDHLQILQSRLIMDSKCISKLGQPPPQSSHDHGLQVHLQTRSITASKCILKLAQSRCGDTTELESREQIINTPPHLLQHPKGICEIERFWLKDVIGYLAMRNHTNCVDLWRLGKSAWGTTQIAWINQSLARVRGTNSWER